MTTQQQQQKRSAAEAAESLLEKVRAIVFDVEGTTVPLTYLKDIMTPEHVEYHLRDTIEEPDTIKDVAALRELSKKEKDGGVAGAEEIPEDADGMKKKVASNTQRWIDSNPHCAEFKAFRNRVVRHLLECGKAKADVFDDVPPMLRMLSEEGFNLYVYSSENEEFYKMLYANTSEGDITDAFLKYFNEETMGPKTDKESYKKIAAEIKIEPENILYLNDIPEEADAACKAGWRCALVIRPGNADLTDEHLQNFACIEQFDELYGDEDEETEDIKRFHGDDNGEAEDDEEEDENDDEVDEDEEGEEEEGEGEGEDA